MSKHWLIIGLSCAIFLSACSKDKEEPVEVTSVETTSKDKTKKIVEQVGLTEEQQEQLNVVEKITLGESILSLEVALENTSNEKIPLPFKKDLAFEVSVLDENGNELASHHVTKGERENLNKKESIVYEYELEVGKEYGTYEMIYSIPLLDEKGELIEELTGQAIEYDYEKPVTYSYMPSTAKTLVYENNNGSGVDIVEEFMYFEKGYAQSYNTSVGGNTIYYSDDSGYYRVYSEVSDRKINILKEIAPTEELLLPLPIKEGKTWKVEGLEHKVVEDSITINTAYGTLKNVSVVEANIGSKVRFYYHKDFGMVRTDVANEEGNFETLVELKEVR